MHFTVCHNLGCALKKKRGFFIFNFKLLEPPLGVNEAIWVVDSQINGLLSNKSVVLIVQKNRSNCPEHSNFESVN